MRCLCAHLQYRNLSPPVTSLVSSISSNSASARPAEAGETSPSSASIRTQTTGWAISASTSRAGVLPLIPEMASCALPCQTLIRIISRRAALQAAVTRMSQACNRCAGSRPRFCKARRLRVAMGTKGSASHPAAPRRAAVHRGCQYRHRGGSAADWPSRHEGALLHRPVLLRFWRPGKVRAAQSGCQSHPPNSDRKPRALPAGRSVPHDGGAAAGVHRDARWLRLPLRGLSPVGSRQCATGANQPPRRGGHLFGAPGPRQWG